MQSLTLSHITKAFDGTPALSDVGFTVAPGERVALLGHNGAGKSTLMKIVLGLIAADAGEISVGGAAPGSHEARVATAYLPESVAFHPALSGLELVRYYLRLRDQDPGQAMGLLERVGLADAARRRIGTYSKGMRQRVGLAQVLIGQPRLLVLDEPTSGLDPASRREFYAILDGLAASGAAILLSSHALDEVAAHSDRMVILTRGQVVANATLPELRRAADLPIRLHVTARHDASDMVAERLAGRRCNGVGVELTCTPRDKLARLGQISELGALVEDVEIFPPSLDEIYTHFSKGAT